MNKQIFENQQNFDSDDDFEQFRQGIIIPFPKLQEIVYNDQSYNSTIISFLHQGQTKIKRDQLEYALICFSQAEKMLEYGASCGRAIDRNLIICVLHNQACCYQKLGQIDRATKYIEAIMFNVKGHLKSLRSSPNTSNIIEPAIIKSTPQFNRVSLRKKLELAQYYLQYCSICSQSKARKTALQSAQQALNIYKNVFTELKAENHYIRSLGYGPTNDQQKMKNSLKDFRMFLEEVKTQDLEQCIKMAKYYIKRWKSIVRSSPKTIIDKLFKSYSIGNLVQLESLQYNERQVNNSHCFNPEDVIKQFLHYSMGYFQLSTEKRLIAEELYKSQEIMKQKSQQFLISQMHHLQAIILVAIYIPYDILFMEQLQTSYQNHYGHRLTESLPEQYQPRAQILFSFSPKKPILSKKRKRQDNKSITKSKRSLGTTLKISQQKLKKTQLPKNQYYTEGLEEQKRSQRILSIYNKSNKRDRMVSVERNQSKRERMKTRNGEFQDRDQKKKQRACQEYNPKPTPYKNKLKQAIYQTEQKNRESRMSSCVSTDEKCQKFDIGSAERKLSKFKCKQDKKAKCKLQTMKRLKTGKKKKNTKNYYI